jgi:hypothetical protein
MFSKISRYRNLPDVAVQDAKGRVLSARSLRLQPEVSGTFRHTVEEADRLDHLAFKYYDQPRDWWRIADGNPEFLSPQALLGDEPRSTIRLPLRWEGPSPPWSELLRALQQRPGVETAFFGAPELPQAAVEVVQGRPAFTVDPALTTELDAGVRTQTVTAALAAALSAEGVRLTGGQPPGVRLEKVDAVTWRVTELPSWRIHGFHHFPDEALLQVDESALHCHWVLTVTYNTLTTSAGDLRVLVEQRGFTARHPTEVGRIGKPIVIPPRAG